METIPEANNENLWRTKSLRDAALKTDDADKRRAYTELADRMQFVSDNNLILPSLSDKRYCRYIRKKEHKLIFGALSRYAPNDVRCLHVVLGRSAIPVSGLQSFDFKKFGERQRYHLRHCGISKHTGLIVTRIHGEHEPYKDILLPHTHSIIAGEKRRVIKPLREYYKKIDKNGGVKRRVVVQPLEDAGVQGDYASQSFWPSRYQGPSVKDPEKTVRERRKKRLPPPLHADWLIKMDRTDPGALLLVVGDAGLSLKIRNMYRAAYRKYNERYQKTILQDI